MTPVPSSAGSLRAFTYRLTSTPSKQLPKVAAQIAGSLWHCRDILSSPSDTRQSSDVSTAVHRFKTHLWVLLQDRTVDGRWSAVVLVKSTIEAGGLEVLAKSNAWVRSLVGIVKKPGPPTIRYLAVLTLTRIFMLTWDYANLVREITTPALTALLPVCIANIENTRCSAQELQAVLDAFSTLLPRHPTIFRTHEAQLRTILTTLLSNRSSNENDVPRHYSEGHEMAARKILVLLHICVPKQGGSQKWQETVQSSVLAAHATCDRIFRAIHEDWQSTGDVQPSAPKHLIVKGDAELEGDDLAGLKPWKGVFAGAERLKSLVQLIVSHLVTTTPVPVSVRLGLIADLLNRIFGVTVPHVGKGEVKYNKRISKHERDALFAVLPDIHANAVRLTSAIIERFGSAAFPFVQSILDQIITVFRSSKINATFRLASYRMLGTAIKLAGPAMLRHDVVEFETVLRCCCDELLTRNDATKRSAGTGSANGINQQLGLDASGVTVSHPTDQSELEESATQLLYIVLSRLDSKVISPSLRAQIDRIIVLIRNREALVASVMNPPIRLNGQHAQESLLPILARGFGDAHDVEAILRPRMPTVASRVRTADAAEADDSGDDSGVYDHVEVKGDQDVESVKSITDAVGQAEDDHSTDQLSSVQALSNPSRTAIGKRRALDNEYTATPAKRFRESPIPQGGMPERTTTPLEHDPADGQAESSQSVPFDPSRECTADNNVVEATKHTGTSRPSDPYGIAAAASDDSDFEMPPLTMEPDTEDEEENEE